MSRPSEDPPAPVFRIRVAGDQALAVEFGDVIDVTINSFVTALDSRLRALLLPGIVETVPTYRSLFVAFDPDVVTRAAVIGHLTQLSAEFRPGSETGTRRWLIPVTYGGVYGEDLDAVAAHHGITAAEVAHLHAAAEYRVFMIGFAPGFAYLGGLPAPLHTPRRPDPRPRTPAGSISIGGFQAAVTSIEVPSGWHLLGRTPLRTFDLRRANPSLLQPGDHIRFRPIAPAEYERLARLADTGAVTADLEAVA